MDFTRSEPLLRDVVRPVVEELVAAGASDDRLMLIGATCRDVLHQAAGHDSSLRSTADIDLALAVEGWHEYRDLTSTLPAVKGASEIRFRVADLPVDLVPFGSVEDPRGLVPTGAGQAPMNVLGYREAWQTSTPLTLPAAGPTLRVPTIPAFTLLKLSAWASRSAVGEYRDGSDLATAVFWYQQMPETESRLQSEAHIDLLLAAELDYQLAAVMLLVRDATAILDSAQRTALRTLWQCRGDRRDLLATHLANTLLTPWPTNPPTLLEYAGAIGTLIERSNN